MCHVGRSEALRQPYATRRVRRGTRRWWRPASARLPWWRRAIWRLLRTTIRRLRIPAALGISTLRISTLGVRIWGGAVVGPRISVTIRVAVVIAARHVRPGIRIVDAPAEARCHPGQRQY